MNKILVEVSVGELLDKISILEIKKEKISEPESIKFIEKEYLILKEQLNKNIKSVKKLEEFFNNLKKINDKIEFQRFRGNFYVDGIDPWEERKWINKIVKINNISFKVKKNIPRCVAINLKPKTDNSTSNLLKSLKKNFDHLDMGVYLTALEDGKVNIGSKVELN